MEAFETGGHAYHATMPTDALTVLRDVMLETEQYGFDKVCAEQHELGRRVRALLESRGFPSVAAEGFQAPGVVVSYTSDPEIQTGKKFLGVGLQTAAGVPLQCDEGADFRTFRIGLFGLDKLHDPARTVEVWRRAWIRCWAKSGCISELNSPAPPLLRRGNPLPAGCFRARPIPCHRLTCWESALTFA